MRRSIWTLTCLFGLTACAAPVIAEAPPKPLVAPDLGALRDTVWEREEAFAQTMADRDLAAFAEFVSEDAVFFGLETQRGRKQVVGTWKVFFEGPSAPFGWRPERVEVLESGDLALSTGPVLDPAGAVIGRFMSIWRLEGDTWRVVFDRGEND